MHDDLDGAYDTPGILYLEGEELKRTSYPGLIEDLDSLPSPKRVFLNGEISESKFKERELFLASMGCYGICDFCYIQKFYANSDGLIYRVFSVGRVLDDMEKRKGQNSEFKVAGFMDDNFLGHPDIAGERLVDMVDGIKERKLDVKISFQTRSNDIVDYEEQIEYAASEHVLESVDSGIESFCISMLERWNKEGQTGLEMREQNQRNMTTSR